MKSAITTLFLLFYTVAFSQAQIQGIGKFIIDKTTLQNFITYCDTNHLEIDTCIMQSQINYHNESVLRLMPSRDQSEAPIKGCFINNGACYRMREYKVNDILVIKELYFEFLNDTLISIDCDLDTDLDKALEAKYGAGELTTDKKEITCVYKYTGAKNTEYDITYRTTWKSKQITACTVASIYHNDKCEERTLSYFYINDINRAANYSSANEFAKEKFYSDIENYEKEKLKSKLSEF
jgi:hypothetical protein